MDLRPPQSLSRHPVGHRDLKGGHFGTYLLVPVVEHALFPGTGAGKTVDENIGRALTDARRLIVRIIMVAAVIRIILSTIPLVSSIVRRIINRRLIVRIIKAAAVIRIILSAAIVAGFVDRIIILVIILLRGNRCGFS